MVFSHVAESEKEAKDVAAPAMARFIRALVGAAPPDPEDLYGRMLERGTGLFGTLEQVEKQIAGYAEIGVGHIAFVSRFGGMAADAAEQSLRRLAPSAL